MINLFKNIFKKEKRVINLNIDQIVDFFKKEGFLNSNLLEKTSSYFDEIKLIISEIRSELIKLENAKLRNPNIDPKALQIMKGNRISYINKTEIFLNNLIIPNNFNFDSIDLFLKKYDYDLDSFNKSTLKPFYIVSEFFKDNTHNIAKKIKKIDITIKKLKEILKNDSSKKASEIILILNQYNEINDKRNSINEKIKKNDEQINIINEEIENISKKELIIKNSSAYKELSDFLLKKDKLKEDLENEKKIILELFSKIEPGLKKLDYILPNDKLLKEYLNDPYLALNVDDNFELLNYIKKLNEFINSGKIELKDKKKENVINAINIFNKDFINKFKKKFEKINSEIKLLDLKINNFSVGRNLSELEYRKDHLKFKIDMLNKEKESLIKALEKNNNDEILNNIKILLEELTNSIVILNKN
jgi:hypothetical protein